MNKIHKKTILILSCFYEPFEGGAERYVKEITQRLKEKYNFIILTARLSFKLPKYEVKERIKIYRLGIGTKFDKLLYPILAFFKSFSIKKDLIQAVLESYAGLTLLFYRIFDKKTPALLTLQTGRVSIPAFLFKKIHQAPDKIQAISKALAKRARRFGAKNVEVVPNGIDLKRFENLERKSHQGFVVITVARLEKVKGIEYLIKAMSILRSDEIRRRDPMSRSDLRWRSDLQISKSPNLQILNIGDGSERKNLEDLVRKLGLERRVKFLGLIPNEKIPEYLAAADCFVLPSLSEGLGIAILEAQACGVPVIASRVGGISDIIKDGKTGILVEPKNPEAISQAIIKIFSEPEFAQKITQNAKANLEKYDWNNISRQIERIYQELL